MGSREKSILSRMMMLVLSLSIVLGMFFTDAVVYAEDNKQSTQSSIYVNVLTKLGLFKDIYDFNGEDKPIKKWEFLAICSKLTNSYLPVEFETVFADVDKSAPYAPIVYHAYLKKWITKGEDQKFNPEEPITLEQACKILITITGFEPLAISLSGYPVGYLTVAKQNNILSGINISYTEQLNFDVTARLLYNLFKAPFAQQVSFSDDVEYRYGEDTVYSYYHDLYQSAGVIMTTKNCTAGINSKELIEGQIEIDDQIFQADDSYDTMLGKQVDYFYFRHKNSDDNTILHIEPQKNNTELTVDRKKIIGMTDSFTLKYEDEKEIIREKTLKPTTNVIYNGRYAVKLLNYPVERLKQADRIRLLDHNNDGKWDFIFIDKSDIYFINTVSPGSNYFTSFYNDVPPVDLSALSADDMPPVTKDGIKITFHNIKKYNVAYVKRDFSGENIVKIEVSANEVTGKVSAVTQGNYNETFLTIEEKSYEVNSIFSNTPDYHISIGEEASFALDNDNRIIGFKKQSAVHAFGYIVNLGKMEDSFSNLIKIKLLNFEGDLVTYEFADKFYIDSVKYTCDSEQSVSQALDAINQTGTDSNYIGGIFDSEASQIPGDIALKKGFHQLVIYDLDKDGKLSKLDTVAEDANNKITRDFMPRFHASASSSTRYLSAGYIFCDVNSNQRVILNSDTLVYSVPINGKDNEDNYLFGTRAMVKGLEYHTIHAYNVDPETMIAEVLIVEEGTPKNSGKLPTEGSGKRREFLNIGLDTTEYSIITRVVKAIDESGNVATKAYTFKKKEADYFYASDESFIYNHKEYFEKGKVEANITALPADSLKAGQVISNTVIPANKHAKTVCIVMDPPQDVQTVDGTFTVNPNGYEESAFGKLISKKNATIRAEVLLNGEKTTYGFNIGGSPDVYRYNVKTNKVEVFELNSVTYEQNRYVYVRSRMGRIPIIVVYDYPKGGE